MYPVITIRRYQCSLTVGVDEQGVVIKLESDIPCGERSSTFRPTPLSANLMVGSINLALKGGDEFQRFDFVSADGLHVRGQFQETENSIIDRFKRALIIVEGQTHRHAAAGTAYIVVMRDNELKKLKVFFEKAYNIRS